MDTHDSRTLTHWIVTCAAGGPESLLPSPLPCLCFRLSIRQRNPKMPRPGPPAVWLSARLRLRVARPQPPVRTRRQPSVLPPLQSFPTSPLAAECPPNTTGVADPAEEVPRRVLARVTLFISTGVYSGVGCLGSPRLQEKLEIRSSSRDPRGEGHATGGTYCSARSGPLETASPGERPGGCSWGTKPRPPELHGRVPAAPAHVCFLRLLFAAEQ